MKYSCWPALAAVLILSGCGGGGSPKTFTTLADFKGAKVASEKGALFSAFVDSAVPNVEHLLYEMQSDIVAALLEDRADAACFDMPIARHIVARNPSLVIFPIPVMDDRYGFAVAKGSELGARANEVLHGMIGRGTVRRLRDTWLSADGSKSELPALSHRADFDGSAGTITYGYGATSAPVSYTGQDGKPAGLEPDIVNRIAYGLNMNVAFVPMLFDELLPAISGGKADMVGSAMSITEERLKKFDFVGPYMEGGAVLVIKKRRAGKWSAENGD